MLMENSVKCIQRCYSSTWVFWFIIQPSMLVNYRLVWLTWKISSIRGTLGFIMISSSSFNILPFSLGFTVSAAATHLRRMKTTNVSPLCLKAAVYRAAAPPPQMRQSIQMNNSNIIQDMYCSSKHQSNFSENGSVLPQQITYQEKEVRYHKYVLPDTKTNHNDLNVFTGTTETICSV